MKRFCLFGLGEAGTLFSRDLLMEGISVNAYDPASVDTPVGVQRFDNPAQAVAGVDVVLAMTASIDALEALTQAFEAIPAGALYADFSTSTAQLKLDLAALAAQRAIEFVDVALLAVVPGNGARTPSLVSGTGAERFVDEFSTFGMSVKSLGEAAGDAATRKLLRSVFMKGLAGVVIEAMAAAEKVGLSDWLWDNITTEIELADEALLHRLVAGTQLHAERRLHEMEASASLLSEFAVEPLMTESTVRLLKKVLEQGLPYIPALLNDANSFENVSKQ